MIGKNREEILFPMFSENTKIFPRLILHLLLEFFTKSFGSLSGGNLI